jgi:hypothetical protein
LQTQRLREQQQCSSNETFIHPFLLFALFSCSLSIVVFPMERQQKNKAKQPWLFNLRHQACSVGGGRLFVVAARPKGKPAHHPDVCVAEKNLPMLQLVFAVVGVGDGKCLLLSLLPGAGGRPRGFNWTMATLAVTKSLRGVD